MGVAGTELEEVMLAAEENFCWYNDDEGVGRCGAEVESPARVEETCVPLLTSLTSRFRGRVRCVWVQCKGDIAVTYREEMKAWAIRVNWEFFDHGENWGDSDVQEIMRET